MFFTLACRRSWATRCSTSSCYASSTGLHAHTAIKKTTQGSYPIILLMLSARGRAFSLFNYLRYHCYEICSQFMKVRWNCSTAAFASNECHRNSTVFQNKRAHPQMRNIVSLQKKMHLSPTKYLFWQFKDATVTKNKMHWRHTNTLEES